MKRVSIGFVALVALSLGAAARSGEESARTAAHPAFVRMEASPERIEFTRSIDRVQLLVLGHTEEGGVVDLTREAMQALGEVPAALSIGSDGQVRPLADGTGVLELSVGDAHLSLPYSVRDLEQPFDPSFRRDVAPILSKAGCNMGTCHGSAKGKNGFKLSLRGYDADFDHLALTDDLAGRRLNRAAPADSLFLRKPTGEVPHEGGVRLDPASADLDLLREWVLHGAKLDPRGARVQSIALFPPSPTLPDVGMQLQFRVVATYTDGTERDITRYAFVETSDPEVLGVDAHGLSTAVRRGDVAVLARYEGAYASTRVFVMGDRSGFSWTHPPADSYVDEKIERRLAEIRTEPSPLCSDAEFLRRVSLDLVGLPPTAREVRAFLADTRDTAVKRRELIDRLIGSAEYLDHWSNRWCDLLQVNPKFLGEEGAASLREWIRSAIASNMPYDQFVRALLATQGSTLHDPPAAYYKVLRTPDGAMENTTQLFLGVRFSCNKCHDHPFERWTQQQHWSLAAYFAQVDRQDAPGSAKMAASTVMAEGEQPPAFEEIVADRSEGQLEHEGRQYLPAFPYEHSGEVSGSTRREQLAEWLTAPENPYFARSFVNRTWSYLFGIGLIEPVDDLRAGNPPTHPELLEQLTQDFVASGFDVRQLLRLLCNTRAYQRSVETNDWNADDTLHFAHATARRLPAETLFDAVQRATGHRASFAGVLPGVRASEVIGRDVDAEDGFLGLFGRPARESACECERSSGVSLGQALNLVNGPTVADAVQDPRNDLHQLLDATRDGARIAEELYLRLLSRPPTAQESEAVRRWLDPAEPGNLDALSAEDRSTYDQAFAEWSASIPSLRWEPWTAESARSLANAKFELHPDQSLKVTEAPAEKDTYTITTWLSGDGWRGLKLEALADPSLPTGGPGLAENGNFVLQQVQVAVIPATNPGALRSVALATATADFSQNDWPVARSIVADDKGWAVSSRFGVDHEAVYEFAETLDAGAGAWVIVSLRQDYGQRHLLGTFRLSGTRSEGPVRHAGVPKEVQEALATAVADRGAEQNALLHRNFVAARADIGEKIRRCSAEDLCWALLNSPEFLFQH